MPSDLQNLDTFFNKRLFRVPDYQRGYAWEEHQWEDFWQDLNSLGEERKHYTGQITIEKVGESAWQRWDDEKWLIVGKAYRPFYVVDGQQRLTTVVILLKCLIDRMPDDGQLAFNTKGDLWKTYLLQTSGEVSQAFLFGYERDNPSNEYLKTQILGQSSNAYNGTETTYTANLEGAREFFREKLRNATPNVLERLFKALTQRFVFSVYELEDDLDEFVVFETMNNRGKPLSKLELLKNRLIYLSTLYPNPESGADLTTLRKNINEAWKTVYEYLGKVKGCPLDDDDFLRAHWIMYFTYARSEAEQFASFLLEEKFTAERVFSNELSVAEIQQYVDSIQRSVRKWHQINFPEHAPDLPDSIRVGFQRLARLGGRAFAPLAMAVLQKSFPEAEQLRFLEATEQFAFLVGKLCRRRANVGDSEFYRLAHDVYLGGTTLMGAIKRIAVYTEYYFSLDKATTEIKDLFKQAEGFYSWTGLHYFLFEYEQHLREKSGMEGSKLNWHEFTTSKTDRITIEHIFPQTPIPKDWPSFSAYTEADSHALLNSLGNLLALSRSRNAKFSRRPFAKKCIDEDGVQGYYNGSYSEIQVAQSPDWTPRSIVMRGLEMLDFLESRWGKSLGTREDKLKLLNLDGIQITEESDSSEPVNSENTNPRKSGLPPVVDENTEILILGSLPSDISLATGQYYANPNNDFWKLIGTVLNQNFEGLSYEDKLDLLKVKCIGLWDAYHSCVRPGSMDKNITEKALNDFTVLKDLAPQLKLAFFNGQGAAEAEEVLHALHYQTRLLPSSSPANRIDQEGRLATWMGAFT